MSQQLKLWTPTWIDRVWFLGRYLSQHWGSPSAPVEIRLNGALSWSRGSWIFKIITFSPKVKNKWRVSPLPLLAAHLLYTALTIYCEGNIANLGQTEQSHHVHSIYIPLVSLTGKYGDILFGFLVWLSLPVRAQTSFLPVILFVCTNHPKCHASNNGKCSINRILKIYSAHFICMSGRRNYEWNN
jgi:hypothetical protein